MTLVDFVRESNAIEGILREPTAKEIAAFEALLGRKEMTIEDLNSFQTIVAPGNPIRNSPHMNVRVGNHIAPRGGREIVDQLTLICANADSTDPWKAHVAFETLHPYLDGNGRTGRALWAWQMLKANQDPFALPFLHRWYYQTLENSR